MVAHKHPAARSPEDRNALVVQWLGLVPHVLRIASHRPTVCRFWDECRGAAYVALIRAAELYKSGPVRFPAYARQFIYGAILKEARRLGRERWQQLPVHGWRGGGPAAPVARGVDDVEVIRQAVATLDKRLCRIVELRFGLDGRGEREFAEIGRQVGLSRAQSGRLLQEALEILGPRLRTRGVA